MENSALEAVANQRNAKLLIVQSMVTGQNGLDGQHARSLVEQVNKTDGEGATIRPLRMVVSTVAEQKLEKCNN